MQQLVWETAEELDQKLAQRVRNIRKRRSISQEKLASMSGVSYGSINRFETTGMISLLSWTKIAMALDMAAYDYVSVNGARITMEQYLNLWTTVGA